MSRSVLSDRQAHAVRRSVSQSVRLSVTINITFKTNRIFSTARVDVPVSVQLADHEVEAVDRGKERVIPKLLTFVVQAMSRNAFL